MTMLFFGATKGLTGLMGMSALMFGLAVNRIEVQMDDIEPGAPKVQQAVPDLIPVPAE
jgi:hypothetical protein